MTVPQGDLPDYLASVGATVAEIWSGTIPPGSNVTVDVTAYNSVLIAANQDPGIGPISLWYEWLASFVGSIVDAGLLSANISTVPPNGAGPSWVLPARGGRLSLGNDTAVGIAVVVIGQPADSEWRMNSDGDPSRPFSCLIPAAAAANTVIPFTTALAAGVTAPLYRGVTSYNGLVTYSLNTAAGTSGAIEAVWLDSKGNLVATPILIDSGGGARSQLLTHPRAYCTWQYRLSAAAPAAAHNAFLSITPS